jgi:hypothetical protein
VFAKKTGKGAAYELAAIVASEDARKGQHLPWISKSRSTNDPYRVSDDDA